MTSRSAQAWIRTPALRPPRATRCGGILRREHHSTADNAATRIPARHERRPRCREVSHRVRVGNLGPLDDDTGIGAAVICARPAPPPEGASRRPAWRPQARRQPLDCGSAESEAARDLSVGQPFANQHENLLLMRREPLRPRRSDSGTRDAEEPQRTPHASHERHLTVRLDKPLRSREAVQSLLRPPGPAESLALCPGAPQPPALVLAPPRDLGVAKPRRRSSEPAARSSTPPWPHSAE